MTTNTKSNENLSFLSEYMRTFPCDRLPRVTEYPAVFILNTDLSTNLENLGCSVY